MLDTHGTSLYNAARLAGTIARRQAQVAQLVEQRTENPRVGGSIPPLGTMYFNDLWNIRSVAGYP